MPSLLLTALVPRSGKTTIAAGVATRLRAAGRTVGFVRLAGDSGPSADAAALSDVVGAEHTRSGTDAAAACRELAKVDVLLIEGDFEPARVAAEDCHASVMLVLRGTDADLARQIEAASAAFGARLVATIVNGVPKARVNFVRSEVTKLADPRGIAVIGVFPQARALAGVSVRELAHRLAPAQILGDPDRDQVIDTLMVGTMGLDNALFYFGRRQNKAAIISVNRPDLMIAALQTPTLCIVATSANPVVTGSQPVNPIVVSRAREMDVPILVSGRSTLDTVQQIEAIFSEADFRGPGKVDVARSLVDEHLDLDRLAAVIAR